MDKQRANLREGNIAFYFPLARIRAEKTLVSMEITVREKSQCAYRTIGYFIKILKTVIIKNN